MEMPPIHMCVFLSHEHEQLKAKIVQLKNHITSLEQTITRTNLGPTRSCSISCQTDIAIQRRLFTSQPVKTSFDEEAHLHRLLNDQNELLRKYENEAMHKRQSQLSPPSSMIEDYERRLARCQREKKHAEQRAVSAQQRFNRLERRQGNLREQMNVLDDGFFEEVDDLKFAVQQALGLNREYEKTIQMLSARLGINYPVQSS